MKYKGKLGALPHDVQLSVAYALMDGQTYDEVRDMLRADGFTDREIPAGNRGFISFQRSPLYQRAVNSAIHLHQRAKLKSALTSELMTGGGLDQLAAAGNAHALVEAMDAYERGELDPDTFSKIVARSGRALTAVSKNQLAHELAELEKQLKSPGSKQPADPAQVMTRLRQKLGLPGGTP